MSRVARSGLLVALASASCVPAGAPLRGGATLGIAETDPLTCGFACVRRFRDPGATIAAGRLPG